MRGMRSLLAAGLLCAAAPSAHAIDGVSLIYGQGNSVDVFGIEARTADWRQWQLGNAWRMSAYGMGSAAYWRAREPTENKELWDSGAAPALRPQRTATGPAPSFEASPRA